MDFEELRPEDVEGGETDGAEAGLEQNGDFALTAVGSHKET